MGNLSHFIAYRSVCKHLPFEQNSAQLPVDSGDQRKAHLLQHAPRMQNNCTPPFSSGLTERGIIPPAATIQTSDPGNSSAAQDESRAALICSVEEISFLPRRRKQR